MNTKTKRRKRQLRDACACRIGNSPDTILVCQNCQDIFGLDSNILQINLKDRIGAKCR